MRKFCSAAIFLHSKVSQARFIHFAQPRIELYKLLKPSLLSKFMNSWLTGVKFVLRGGFDFFLGFFPLFSFPLSKANLVSNT